MMSKAPHSELGAVPRERPGLLKEPVDLGS